MTSFSARCFSALFRPAALGLLTLAAGPALAQVPAFPGAEGAGKFTTGGRGSTTAPTTVMEVTTLADSGTGSLRAALTGTLASRTVVFRVCGTIHLVTQLRIPANTTLAGQTAPGDGICLADKQVSVNGNNVIVRFMRFRLGDQYQNLGMVNGSGDEDAFDGVATTGLIVDHCTASWSNDEAFTFYRGDNLTLQWNLISEPLNYSYHFETGDADYEHHGFGGIWGGRHASFHHNLFAHCNGRVPRFDGSRNLTPYTAGQENAEFVNNVIYNWGSYATNGGEGGNYNILNNYYKYGPSTLTGSSVGVAVRSELLVPYKTTTAPILPYGQFYLTGNYSDNSTNVTAHNWRGVSMAGGVQADTTSAKALTPFTISAYPLPFVQTPQDAYTAVLANAGCVLPTRDALDQRIVQDVRSRTGAIIDVQGGYVHGTPYSTSQAAWPTLTCGAAPLDTDHDGMPDAWEISMGLNPNNAADRATIATNGYANLENYLNGLVATTVLGTRAATNPTLLSVYPNPAQAGRALTVVHPATASSFRIYSFDGRLVQSVAVLAGTTQTQVDVSGLATGNYLLVSEGPERLSVKFLKAE